MHVVVEQKLPGGGCAAFIHSVVDVHWSSSRFDLEVKAGVRRHAAGFYTYLSVCDEHLSCVVFNQEEIQIQVHKFDSDQKSDHRCLIDLKLPSSTLLMAVGATKYVK